MDMQNKQDLNLTAKEREIVLLVLEVIGQLNARPELAFAPRERAAAEAPGTPSLDDLTPRERDVLPLLLEGATTKEIALELGLSPKTVTSYRVRILQKLGVRSSMQLSHLFHGDRLPMASRGTGRPLKSRHH